jgi:signal transduction histidine kinase/DNA-binding response OmpR family regulator
MTTESTPEAAAAGDARVRSDLARLLQTRLLRESGLILLGHPLLIAVVAFVAWPDVAHGAMRAWVAAVVGATTLRGAWLQLVKRRPLSDQDIRHGVRITVVALGLAWGVGAALILPDVPFTTAAVVLVVLAGLIATSLTTLAADPLSFRGFLAAISLPVLVSLGTVPRDREHLAAVGIVALYTLAMVVVARRAHATLVEHLRITARLALSEEEAKRAEGVMRDARDFAERTARARSAFLANMSHEIRTPMNAVLGFVELVLDTDLTTEQRRALELVRSSSEALLMILNDILDYSKIEAEHLELETIPFDVSKVVHATASLLAVRAREKHLELLAEVAPEVPRMVRGDPTRLRQVLMNLIGNAIKFTEHGEIVISVGVAVMDGSAALRFAIRDTGIGIAAEHVESIFKEFTQADSTMTRRYGGTGLGLAISQRLVRLMGGELAVTSEVGRGSEFAFTLTLPVETASSTRTTALAALGGRRMLIVDDNQTNRRILRDMLAAEGIQVDEASTAADGLTAIRSAVSKRAPYHLAILDVQMPDMDGFQLATAVRAERVLTGTKLLMLTSAGQRGDGERCRELGIKGYLTKPISRGDLLEALGTVLAGSAEDTAEVVTRHTIVESRRSLRVLLAEDNPVNQQVAVAMLVKRGHEVHVASNGREAVDAVRARDYDVVLMDIQMPELDGFEATHAIRAMPKGKDLPIIGLTAHALSGERERCLSHGMTEYLAKPFKAHELFAIVEGSAEGTAASPVGHESPATLTPPVDLEGFRTTLREAGAEQALYSIVDTFVRQASDRLGALAAAVASGTGDEIARAAHVFRGAAATIGARDLAARLERVETSARAGDVELARAAFEGVSPVAHEVIDYLRQQRASLPEE